MTITEVLKKSILAIYRDPVVARALVLKGGSAIRLFEGDMHRLSIDADFSVENKIDDEKKFFERMHKALSSAFKHDGLDVIDFKAPRRPAKQKLGSPPWWGGWKCVFKLVPHDLHAKSLETRRRNALIPEGSNSTVIEIDVSDGEYCGSKRSKTLQGVKIQCYTRELLVLEKIRAICQQHPSYKYTTKKNRARDFYDIQRMTEQIDDNFIETCQRHLGKVFLAKEVPIELLSAFWDPEFLSDQELGFQEVIDTVQGKVEVFEVYIQHARHLIRQIRPEVAPSA